MSREKTRPNVRVRIENHKKVKIAHNTAAEAHLKAADANEAVITADDTKVDAAIGQAAVQLTKEAMQASEQAIEAERRLMGRAINESLEAWRDAKLAGSEMLAAKVTDLHRDAHEEHEAAFREHAIMEHEAQVERHQKLIDKAKDDVRVENVLIEEHQKQIKTLLKVGQPPMMETPEYEAFAALVGNLDWAGRRPDDMWGDYVEPALIAATVDFARQVGLEIPDSSDDLIDEGNRNALFGMVEAAYVSHLFSITNIE